MKNKRKFFDRRKHRRFKVPIDTFAIVKNQSFKLGQIADMSAGGISFYYISEKELIHKELSVDIMLARDNFYLDNLPVNIISNIVAPVQTPIKNGTFKRCGLEFRNLTSSQIVKLSSIVPSRLCGFLKDQRVA